MKGIIIYKGKYGATRQYAEWLGRQLQLPVHDAQNMGGTDLKAYDYLVLGASVYIGKIQLKKWLHANFSWLEHKKIFFFQVAATPPEQTEKRQSYNRSGIPSALMPNCEFFFLPGKLTMKDLSFTDRFMLRMGARMAKNSEDRKRMLTDYNEIKEDYTYVIADAVRLYCRLHEPAQASGTAL